MDRYRLPCTVVPSRYEIELEPDLERGKFTGRETVDVTVRETVQEIILNAADLEIRAASIRGERGIEQNALVTIEGAEERLRLRFPEPLQPGDALPLDHLACGIGALGAYIELRKDAASLLLP